MKSVLKPRFYGILNGTTFRMSISHVCIYTHPSFQANGDRTTIYLYILVIGVNNLLVHVPVYSKFSKRHLVCSTQ